MTLTDAEMVAAIEGIIEANARALNEQPTVGLRLRPDGSVRIQDRSGGKWVRGRRSYKHYPSLASCYEAAQVAARRAALVEELVASGIDPALAVSDAIATVRA